MSPHEPEQESYTASNFQPTSSPDVTAPLTPCALSEAEAALQYNEALQTSSAGQPQPTTPENPPPNNHVWAAQHATAPYPPSLQAQGFMDSAMSVRHEYDAAAPPLSRGTTRVVLEKMASPEFGSELRKRMSREGERRTDLIPIRPAEIEQGMDTADSGDNEKDVKPALDRQQTWSQEDMKRARTERLMGPVDEGSGGYSSAG